jgi:hypothetical protein
MILEAFSAVIVETRTSLPSSGVDMAREMRLHKCNTCLELLVELTPSVGSLLNLSEPSSPQLPPSLATAARVLHSLLNKMASI